MGACVLAGARQNPFAASKIAFDLGTQWSWHPASRQAALCFSWHHVASTLQTTRLMLMSLQSFWLFEACSLTSPQWELMERIFTELSCVVNRMSPAFLIGN